MILTKLIENDGLASGAFLSASCNLSINTIRSEIAKLNEELKEYDATISSHIANGYRLIISDEEKFRNMIKQQQRYSYLNISDNSIAYHIICELLSTSKYLSIENLMDELYCSRSTIVRIIEKVRKHLDRYQLKIINKKNYGLQIEGSEWNKRLCLIKLEKIKRHDQNVYANESNFKALFLLDSPVRRTIRSALIDHFSHDPSFFLSQIELPEIYNLIILNHTRKQYLTKDEPVLSLKDVPTSDLAQRLYARMPEEIQKEAGENEARLLAVQIASLAFPNKSFLEDSGLLNDYIAQSRQIVSYFRNYFELPFEFSDTYHENMAAFLYRLDQQLRCGKTNDREYIDSSFSRGIASADICSCLGLWFYEKHKILLSDTILVHAYYIINRELIVNEGFYRPLRIAVVSRNGMYYSQNIAERLRSKYSKYIKELDCVNFYQLEDYDWSKTDVLLSDLFFGLLPSAKPSVITVPLGPLHDKTLFEALDNYLEQYIRLDAMEMFARNNLRHIFAKDIDEVYDEIYDICNDEVGDRDRFIKDLKLHEQMTGAKRTNGIVSMSTFALRTKEPIFLLVLTQKPVDCEEGESSIFLFYSYGDGSYKNRYLISWLIQRFYSKKADWLNVLFTKDYQWISQEL